MIFVSLALASPYGELSIKQLIYLIASPISIRIQFYCNYFFDFLSSKPGFPDPGWKAFYDSATPHVEKMPDPWDAVSGLDR